MTILGVIGGSGFERLEKLQSLRPQSITTPYGEPSAPPLLGAYNGREVVFLPRHGQQHDILPHAVNYRANLFALKELGVSEVLSLSAVGGIAPRMVSRVMVAPHQLIDYTWGREHTFHDGSDHAARVGDWSQAHVDFTQPYCERMRARLVAAAKSGAVEIIAEGVYAAVQGPRLESAAEIDRLERDGADVVGMTGMPEASLARELALPYACLAMVVNEAAGRGSGEVSMQAIRANLEYTRARALTILDHFA